MDQENIFLILFIYWNLIYEKVTVQMISYARYKYTIIHLYTKYNI